ncbi:sugar phosphate isomerase/epimerase family protein [Bythopirellula goksoeyrii]|uniref:Fructoselysine 3-epimerase n=1 Tax=Bythopirellula goksoeyrii TaxID=1400387 RepID=A0A5B9QQP1_9BACT|nr:sugar phosphate isomerase/epimerase family protein [Bythopirellula goksoeyrii]QEG36283.1 fructoselysine 3-epimerase [Bythopirellula goksoeyrii]
MGSQEAKWPLGIFVSVDRGLGIEVDLAHELGVTTVHLHVPSRELRSPIAANKLAKKMDNLRLQITVVFAGFDGEDYKNISTVQRTIGLVPESTRPDRMDELKEIIDYTSCLNVGATGLHIGVIPKDSSDITFGKVVESTSEVCEYAAQQGVNIHLETGQESSDDLLNFLKAVNQSNLYVNFDPANMILYGSGEPIPALKMIGPYVRSVHIKDALWSAHPGITWGLEVPLGEGALNIAEYLRTLDAIGYFGPLTIEREIPHDPVRQKAELSDAIKILDRFKQGT